MAEKSQTRRVRFGAFVVDFKSCEIFKLGIRIKLQDQPFQILSMLLDRPGELVSREELRKKLWRDDTFVDFDAGLNAAIRRLRDALNESADQSRYVETLPRHGYRFIGEVEKLPEPVPVKVETCPESGKQTVRDNPPEAVLARSATASSSVKNSWMLWLAVLAVASGSVFAVTIGTPNWRHHIFSTHASAGIRSVAVLPLRNLSGDPNQDYFAEGMTDALITDLAQTKSLRVISRASAMRYKGTPKKLPEIASELNVDAVLEGAVIRSGDRVRVDAQLIRADTDQHLWARTYERKITDVLSLQADVAQAIATEIEANLNPEEQSRFAAKRRVVDPQVYESDLKGRYFSSRLDDKSLKRGAEFFQEAIHLDPSYASAYAGLSENYSLQAIGWGGGTKDPEKLAIQAARKAISLDDTLAEAHASLAFVLHRHMQDWAGAEKEFKRAIELNPGYAMAHHRYGVYLRTVGLPDPACDQSRIAHDLDPLNTAFTSAVAACINATGRFEEAVRMMNDAIEMEPGNHRLRWDLGDIYERKDMFPEALAQYQKGADLSGRHPYLLSLMASAYAGWGKTAEAEKLLEEIKQKHGEDGWLSSVVHARMGRKEQAIRELVADSGGKCGPGKCGPGASLFVSEWRFDPLRADPRFQALLDLYHYPESARRK